MNYIGSKKTLSDFIIQTIEKTVPLHKEQVFCDIFAGTGIIGQKFRLKGYNVISNDIQYYSYVINKNLIEGNIDNIHLEEIDKLNYISGEEGFIYNHYCQGSGSKRLYFSDYNGKKCDAIRNKIELLFQNREIDEDNYYFLLSSLLNSIDKYANTASVYGAFLKTLKKRAAEEMVLTPLLPPVGIIGKVYNQNANQLIESIKGDILYIDPPYNSRQYGANYHLLETIARNDAPIIKGKTGLRQKYYHSDYCYKVKAENSLNELIKKAKFKYIFLSYNDEGIIPLKNIQEILSQYGEYQCFYTPYKRFQADKKSKRNILKNTTYEYLHCLIKENI